VNAKILTYEVLRWVRKASAFLLYTCLILLIFIQFIRALPDDEPRDFGSFYASGQAAAKGLNPYDVYPLSYHVKSKFFDEKNPNLNPPITVLLFEMISIFEIHTLFKIWWYLSVLIYLLCLWLLIRRYHGDITWWQLLLAFALPGVWDTFYLGQIYMPLLLAVVTAWLFLEHNHYILAGLAVAVVVSIKPNFLVWPWLLFLSGYRRTSLTAVGVFALICMIPIVIYGFEIYEQWFHLVINNDPKRISFPTNISIYALAFRSEIPKAALPLSLIILIIISVLVLKIKPSLIETTTLSILISLLISPIAWIHYIIFLLPIFFYRVNIGIKIVFSFFVFPLGFIFMLPIIPLWIYISIGSIYNWVLLLMFAMFVKQIAVQRLDFLSYSKSSLASNCCQQT
jgi:hypothetical protein